jgi:hypothetical protein
MSLDCLFTGSCAKISEVYVSVSNYDSVLCGTNASLCGSVEYGWTERLNVNGTIYILDGVHGVNCRSASSWQVVLEGINISSDGVEADYPGIYPANSGGCWFNISGNGQTIGLKKLRLIYPDFLFAGHFFRSYTSDNYINVTNCFIYRNSSSLVVTDSIFYGDYGYTNLVNTVIHDIVLNSYSILKFAWTNLDVHFSCFNCTFYSISSNSTNCAIFFLEGPIYNNMSNISFINISASNVSSNYGGVMHWYIDAYGSISNLYFANITSLSSALRFCEAGYIYTFSYLEFYNVSCTTNGGGVYISSNSSIYKYSFNICKFSMCSTSNLYGGMLFVYIL